MSTTTDEPVLLDYGRPCPKAEHHRQLERRYIIATIVAYLAALILGAINTLFWFLFAPAAFCYMAFMYHGHKTWRAKMLFLDETHDENVRRIRAHYDAGSSSLPRRLP